jgi:hypothetical protein
LNYIFQKTPYVSILYSKYLDYPSRNQLIPIEKSGYPQSQPYLRISYFPRLPSDVSSNLAVTTLLHLRGSRFRRPPYRHTPSQLSFARAIVSVPPKFCTRTKTATRNLGIPAIQ